jgi:Mrp family chromosome partitioning ATPase
MPVPALARRATARREPAAAQVDVKVVPFGLDAILPSDVLREMTALRVSLEVAITAHTPRTVVFLAAQSGAGTTTVAAQFARALAGDDRLRILLVDANAQRSAYGPDGRALSGHEPRGAVYGVSAPRAAGNLDFMPLPESARQTHLLPVEAMRDSLRAVASGYDWIVLDGPPVLESPDAAPIGAVADGVVIVVQAGRTKRPVLARTVDLLRRAGGQVLGIVLNRRRLEIPEFIYRRI